MPVPHFEPTPNLIKKIIRLHETPPKDLPRFGARFIFLLVSAYMCISRGFIFLFTPVGHQDLPVAMQGLTGWWVEVYSWGWILAGLMCIWCSLNRRWWPWMFAMMSAPSAVWAIVYAYGGSWNGGLIYHAIALMIFWGAMVPPRQGFKI